MRLLIEKIVLLFIIFSNASCTWIIENHDNPYDFTTIEPNSKDIVGTYKLSETSRKKLKIPTNISDSTFIIIKSNNTFEFINLPEYEVYSSLKNFKAKTEKGKWEIKLDQGCWSLQITIIDPNTGLDSKHILNQYHLNKNIPPYEIIKVVDIETWEAIEFEKN